MHLVKDPILFLFEVLSCRRGGIVVHRRSMVLGCDHMMVYEYSAAHG